jgi:hypothetical protein
MNTPLNTKSVFAPLTIALCTLVLWFGTQTSQLLEERDTLGALVSRQSALHLHSQRTHILWENLTQDLSRLAQSGNVHAVSLVQGWREQGEVLSASELGLKVKLRDQTSRASPGAPP